MNLLKSLLIVLMLAIPAIANSQPYDVDEFISERVGIKELQNISKVSFESGNYRLDHDFILGYGDTIEINLWGKIEGSYELIVDRNGNIAIPLIGSLKIAGLGMSKAYNAIESVIDRKYSNVNFDLAIKDVKDIRIAISGNVEFPGPYAVSPFCKVVEALARCGGPNKNGSLCDIHLIRDGKVIANFSFYNFFRKNDQSQNIRLKHGDTIYVATISNTVLVKGDVRYPGMYEIKNGTNLNELLSLTGGMLPTKLDRKLLILRINPDNKLRQIFKEAIFKPEEGIDKKDDIVLENDDIIVVSTKLDYTPKPESLYKAIYLKGKFVIPGEYIADEQSTLSSIIKKAGGVKKDGFVKGAIYTKKIVQNAQKSILDKLVRQQKIAILEEEAYIATIVLAEEERQLKQRAIESKKKALNLMASRIPNGRVVFNLEDVLKGNIDIIFSDGDTIYISAIPDWVIVAGKVYNPQSVFFENGKDFNYYISITGGLTSLADSENIYVIKAAGSAESKSTGFEAISRGDIIIVPEKTD